MHSPGRPLPLRRAPAPRGPAPWCCLLAGLLLCGPAAAQDGKPVLRLDGVTPDGVRRTATEAWGAYAFKLTNASAKASEPGGAAGTAGAAAAPASTASEYKLDASESKLSAHVGHKVEITGTVEAAKPTASASDAPNLKVDSVKMIAASCS